MVLGSRRRAITLAASALAAVAFAAAVAGRGCSVDDDSPEGAARAFAAAAKAGDRAAIHKLLGPATRARLARATKRATDLVGGAKRFDELDLIGLGSPLETFVVNEFIVKGRIAAADSGGERDVTIVELVDGNGRRSQLTMVEVAGSWRVEVPEYMAGSD